MGELQVQSVSELEPQDRQEAGQRQRALGTTALGSFGSHRAESLLLLQLQMLPGKNKQEVLKIVSHTLPSNHPSSPIQCSPPTLLCSQIRSPLPQSLPISEWLRKCPQQQVSMAVVVYVKLFPGKLTS